ncbi:unnamed protein product [Penicillium salamii]|uniref:SET domain-containing protein n=1 Tax=Penicillium salamii TaxID=1612424 RepID=A0A9W4JVY3_9EURO|nr:unnamed protein product [Penicillium salamii]CAG8310990.1 unnamed protein product [Penicillium salamii]CAG8329103.1 unnamed protein product [Penicillium salamii]CAG8409368.1 unnamed protein product [Penicillium salamii]CAG8414070.1 unnamed protein product [Penicillium salamii]
MKPEWWPGEEHAAFTEWAFSNGIETDAVTPARLQGRGLGMVATRNIKKGDAVLRVPTKLMVTVDDIPTSFTEKLPEDIAVQALLAGYLTHGDPEQLKRYDAWRKSWPSRQDFEDSMPILWPTALGGPQWPMSKDTLNSDQPSLLPPSISGLWPSLKPGPKTRKYTMDYQDILAEQAQRLRKAWTDITSAYPETNWEDFSYHWLIVNTRSFYWVGEGKETPEDPNDAMGLVPFADYFNHADVARDVKFDEHEYVFRATKDYQEGEEVFMNYGSHPNDTLLAECRSWSIADTCATLIDHRWFTIDTNASNYQVTPHGPCYRTEIAACLSYMKEQDWRNHVLEGQSEGLDETRSEATIKRWILTYAAQAEAGVSAIQKAIEVNPTVQEHRPKAELLLKRWKQIKDLCEHAAETVSI